MTPRGGMGTSRWRVEAVARGEANATAQKAAENPTPCARSHDTGKVRSSPITADQQPPQVGLWGGRKRSEGPWLSALWGYRHHPCLAWQKLSVERNSHVEECSFLRLSPYSVLIILGFGEVLKSTYQTTFCAHSKLVPLPHLKKSWITSAHEQKNPVSHLWGGSSLWFHVHMIKLMNS